MENETINNGFENIKTCLNDIHDRISKLEPSRKTEHYFYDKDLNTGTWIVRCARTGGTFSTNLWRLEKYPQQVCPCCGETIRRQTK
jgi:hypothetical protein